MLRFFRHIRKTLMEQNKVRSYIFYAIGEIALVMIGILLALQVNNWNENRKESQREVAYLERLSENLNGNLRELDLNIKFYSKVFDYGQQALAYSEGEKPEVSNWDFIPAKYGRLSRTLLRMKS